MGWGAGAGVVAIAASLLLTIIGLGRRITGQAHEITETLDGAQATTSALWDVATTNSALDRTTRSLAAVRTRLEAS